MVNKMPNVYCVALTVVVTVYAILGKCILIAKCIQKGLVTFMVSSMVKKRVHSNQIVYPSLDKFISEDISFVTRI